MEQILLLLLLWDLYFKLNTVNILENLYCVLEHVYKAHFLENCNWLLWIKLNGLYNFRINIVICCLK